MDILLQYGQQNTRITLKRRDGLIKISFFANTDELATFYDNCGHAGITRCFSFCVLHYLIFYFNIFCFSCHRVPYLEERAYWKFTIWSFVIGSISSLAVMLRMRILNRKARIRARQVLSNGSIN